jgi:hypothetical protein
MWDQNGYWLPVEAAQTDWDRTGDPPVMPGYWRHPGFPRFPHHGKSPWFKYPRRRRRQHHKWWY